MSIPRGFAPGIEVLMLSLLRFGRPMVAPATSNNPDKVADDQQSLARKEETVLVQRPDPVALPRDGASGKAHAGDAPKIDSWSASAGKGKPHTMSDGRCDGRRVS